MVTTASPVSNIGTCPPVGTGNPGAAGRAGRETRPFVDPVLRASGLGKTFRRVRAVDGVDLDVHAGARVGLLGPNGAGKTTTLLMVLGAVTPDEGTVDLLGHRVADGSRRRWWRHGGIGAARSAAMRGVGFAAGYLPLPDRLRVREVLDVFARLYGVGEPRAAVAEGLERFGVAHLADRMCVELSSGQRTLVGIVKAAMHRPRLLVLDEPTASLDPDVAFRVRTGLLDVCANDGTALLVTSHDMLEVERLCERVVFLSGGRVVADGSPQEVAAGYGHGGLEGVFLHLAGTVPPAEEAS
jgi:ABC-2 type transport system ATP-binding protein